MINIDPLYYELWSETSQLDQMDMDDQVGLKYPLFKSRNLDFSFSAAPYRERPVAGRVRPEVPAG